MNVTVRDLRMALSRHRALLSAGLAAGAVATSLGVLAPQAEAGVAVVVAARDLAAGTALTVDDLRVADVPPGLAPAGASASPVALVGRVLAAPLRRGEPLTDVRLAGASLLAAASEGLVAVPVRIADAASAGLVTAGDRVDVLAAASSAGAAGAGAGSAAPPYAAVVASDAQVLAVPTAVQDGGDGALIIVATTPSVAARLAAAAVTSRLSLTLRPRG